MIDSERALDIGLRELFTFEEQRLAELLSQGVGEAIAEVESGGVATATEAAEGGAGKVGLSCVEGNDLDTLLGEELVQPRAIRPRRSPSASRPTG